MFRYCRIKSRSPFTANGSLLDSAQLGQLDALSDEFPALGVFTRPELLCALGEELARIRIETNRLTEICGDIRNKRKECGLHGLIRRSVRLKVLRTDALHELRHVENIERSGRIGRGTSLRLAAGMPTLHFFALEVVEASCVVRTEVHGALRSVHHRARTRIHVGLLAAVARKLERDELGWKYL